MTAVVDLERLLKAGMAAYQQGAYEQAIAALSQLSHTANQTYRLKGKMGLVRTHMAQQDWAKAQALCQEISQSPNLAAQQWAATTLTKVESRIASSDRPDADLPQNLSGFQPLAPADSKATRAQSHQPERDAGISMFHYAYLNGETPDSEIAGEANEAIADEATAEPLSRHDAVEMLCENKSSPEANYGWVYAGRLARGRSLSKIKPGQLWTAQLCGAITFYFLLRYLLHSAIALVNGYLEFLSRILPFGVSLPAAFSGRTWVLSGSLIGIAIASPWLWDIWLRLTADKQPLSSQQLRTYSAEAITVLSRQCQQRRWPLPTLWQLPTEVPLIFSYGWLPRNARLVVSQGLLSQLAADEIAALVAYEISRWNSWHWPLLSVQSLILQLFHQLYWRLALWGDSRPKAIRIAAGILANLSYGVFWLVRIPGLWASRVRTYYGDRAATEITGNPNGLARALAKLSFGLAASIAHQGYTPAEVESLTLLLPVSADLARQPLYGNLPLGQLYAWDSLNPLRGWMSLRDPHPPLGDRLRLMMAYAQYWQLDLEMQIEAPSKRHRGLSASDWFRLVGQGMPFFGLAIGGMTGLGLWLVGAIAQILNWPLLDWMYRDTGLLQCCLLLGLGIGTVLRINRCFPDLAFSMPLTPDLADWLRDPGLLPVSSIPAKLSGTIAGRPELANWLGQDLLLKTPAGLLKLHFFSMLGPLGNVISLSKKPIALLDQSIQVLGWFRRGNQPWLDIDKIRLDNGRLISAAHPAHSLLLAAVACGLGLWLLIHSNGSL